MHLSAELIGSPTEGVPDSLLLTIGVPGVQLLFNAADGFSRLALEHGVRPSGRLRAVLLCSRHPDATGGLPGLVMRLRQDGHDALHVAGPTGVAAVLESLQHFISWRHPAVSVLECGRWDVPVVYKDDDVEVAALWEATTAWQPPAWLRPHQPAAVADVPSAAANVENGRCTVSRDGASVSTADAGDSCSTGNSSGSGNSDSDSEDVSGGGASTGRQAPASAAAAVQLQQPQQQREPALFDRLDALFAKGTQNAAGDLRNGAMRLLQCGHASPSGASAAPPAAAGPANRLLPPNSHQAAARLRSGIAQPVHSQQQGQHSSWPQQTSWQQGMRNGNSAHENPVSVRGRPCPGAEGTARAKQATVLAFLCHIKAGNRLVGIVTCTTCQQLAQLQAHPAMALLRQQAHRLQMLVHLTTPHIATTSAYKRFEASLPEWAIHVRVGDRTQGTRAGFASATRTLTKLNLVSQRVFPLPATTAAAPAAADSSASPANAARADVNGTTTPPQLQDTAFANTEGAGSFDAGQHQREWLEARPRLRLALAALEEEPELQSVREEAAGARSLAHRAGRWQQLWHPRQLEMLQLTRRQWQPGPSQQAGSLQQRPPTGWQQNGNGSQMVQVQLPTPHDRHLKICAAPLPPPPQPWAHEQAPLWPPAYAAHGCQRAHMQPMQVVMPNGQLGLLLTLEPSHTVRAQLEPLPPLQQPQQLSWQLQQPHQQPNLLPLWPPQPPAPWHTGQQPRPPPPAVLQSNAMVPPPQPPPPPPQACPHTMPALQEVPAAAKRQLGDSFTDTDAADRSIRHRSESTVSDAAIDGCFAAAVSNRAAARELRAQLQGSGKAAEPLSPPMAAAARCPASATGAGAREAASIQPADAAPEQQSGATPLAAQDLQDTGVPPACLQQLAQAGDDTEAVFLGTGSAEPSRYRGASGIHLRFASGGGLLMDAGEGSLAALVRSYGARGVTAQLGSLAAVWLSHKHADHMLGLPALLAARPPAAPPLLVIGPAAARRWLAELQPAQLWRYQFLHCAELAGSPQEQWLLQALGLVRVQPVRVEHCADAWALVLASQAGWSVAYSGDTRPCAALERAAAGVTLLIHEATFEPALHAQALKKRHSTTEEAAQVAAATGAYRTVLTHFSQRYPKIPAGLSPDSPGAERVLIAFDGMRVPLAHLPALPRLMPAVMAALEPLESAEVANALQVPAQHAATLLQTE